MQTNACAWISFGVSKNFLLKWQDRRGLQECTCWNNEGVEVQQRVNGIRRNPHPGLASVRITSRYTEHLIPALTVEAVRE